MKCSLILGTNDGNSLNQASEILAEAVRQNIIILSNDILIPDNTRDIQIMWGDASAVTTNPLQDASKLDIERTCSCELEDGSTNETENTVEKTRKDYEVCFL